MESESVRHLSQELFSVVKEPCVQLAQLAQLDIMETDALIRILRQLYTALDSHRRNHTGEYVVSPKLADYVFFPISCVLKHKSLPSAAVQYVLQILAYLNEFSWAFQADGLLDQMLPLVLFLLQTNKDALFQLAAAECLLAVLHRVPTTYFKNSTDKNSTLPKRLSALGDATTALLSFLGSVSPEPLICRILRCLSWLYCSRVSADHASLVFPGIVSKVINFHSQRKNLHTDTLVQIVSLLGALAVKVFEQKDLHVQIIEPSLKLETKIEEIEKEGEGSLKEREWEVENSNGVELLVHTEHTNRTSLWLRATAQQFQLLMLILMKNLILNSAGMNRIRTNPKLGEAILKFCLDIYTHCFRPLFNTMVLASLDILSALCYVTCMGLTEAEFMERVAFMYIMAPRPDLRVLQKHLFIKVEHLASVQLTKSLALLNEEKMALGLAALRVHINVLRHIQEALGTPASDEVAQLAIQNICLFLKQNIRTKKKTEPAKIGLKNSLDGIELPPHIDAKKLGTISRKESSLASVTALAKVNVDLDETEATRVFSTFLTADSEQCIQDTLSFLGETISDFEKTAELILDDLYVSLWAVNVLYKSALPKVKLDDFLDLDIEEEDDEASYILLQRAQDVLSSEIKKGSENPYVVALETLSLVAGRLEKADFQSDVLMEYLFPLLEALTFTPSSIVHQQAKHSLRRIVDAHYGGSLQTLVRENADYLIDSMSLQLSVSLGLTPSLPGILLVVLKISGIDLLVLNQLQDVLSQIFIVIDSYHGYSVLVENFFYVFEEIVVKTSQLYAVEISDSMKVKAKERLYLPWGLSTREQMLEMIDDSNKLIDPFEYEPEKEYFKNPGVPFGDSDDEDEQNEEQQEEHEDEVWSCVIPQNVYALIQQVFTYGLQLLSHPSVKLRVQVLKTLCKAYPIMSTNYTLLMPLLAQHWPALMVLSTGSQSLSQYDDSEGLLQLMAPALELMICIFLEDARHENFMASRFTDMWAYMKKQWVEKKVAPLRDLLCRLLVLGIDNYDRQIPDLTCHDIVRHCYLLGFRELAQTTVKGHLYVLKREKIKLILH